jgi:hypothetical protein
MSRTPQMTIEEQRALFVSRSAGFALTPEEQILANIPTPGFFHACLASWRTGRFVRR